MVVDYLFRVVHAAVTDLDSVSVEDSSEVVMFGKVLVYLGEEFVSNVGAGVLAKRGVYQWMLLRRRFLRLLVLAGSYCSAL